MACAHAKFTGEVGVCLATSGPGAIHLLNGLYDAKLDHQPVVAIVGQQARIVARARATSRRSTSSRCSRTSRSEFVQIVHGARAGAPPDRPRGADRARDALGDLRDRPEGRAGGGVRGAAARARRRLLRRPAAQPRRHPARADLRARRRGPQRRRARRDARRRRARRDAADEVEEVAELLGAGVAKALNGRDVLPDDLPFVTGSIGLLGTKPSDEMMQDCDTLLMVGSSFPYSEWLPEPGQARGVQIDIDARMLGIRYPMEVNLVGDARDTLRALLPLLRAQGGPRLARGDRGRASTAGGDPRRPARRSTRTAQPAARLPRAQPAPARQLHPHRRLRLGARTGGRATCGCAAGCAARCRARWRRWARRVPYALAAKFALSRPAGDRDRSATARCR